MKILLTGTRTSVLWANNTELKAQYSQWNVKTQCVRRRGTYNDVIGRQSLSGRVALGGARSRSTAPSRPPVSDATAEAERTLTTDRPSSGGGYTAPNQPVLQAHHGHRRRPPTPPNMPPPSRPPVEIPRNAGRCVVILPRFFVVFCLSC